MNECSPTDDTHYKHNCHKHATCMNTFGSFTCGCNDGWIGDGTSCTNVDECSPDFYDQCDLETTTCDDNTEDTFGYECPCKTGYKKVDNKVGIPEHKIPYFDKADKLKLVIIYIIYRVSNKIWHPFPSLSVKEPGAISLWRPDIM